MPICFVTNLTIGQLSRAYLLCICFFGVIVFFGVGYFLETALRLCAGVLRRDLGCTAKVVFLQSLVAPVFPSNPQLDVNLYFNDWTTLDRIMSQQKEESLTEDPSKTNSKI